MSSPEVPEAIASGHPGAFFHATEDGRFVCEVCPRRCRLRPGQRGFCFVRGASDEGVVLSTYGRSSGFCIDPIEKKPLNHFYPGSSVLSFGTAGCNLGCKFCQNWSISKASANDRLQSAASPEAIAQAAVTHGCRSVAFTYNDPAVFFEYARDVAEACHQRDVKTVAVTAGYIDGPARESFFSFIDAANIDLKAFSDRFYRERCAARLGPVLDTLQYVAQKTDVWLEVTTLLIPGENDDTPQLRALSEFVCERLGPDVPLHFSAFHPDYRMSDVPPTPKTTLMRARDIARAAGCRHVYVGNVHASAESSTYCPGCGQLCIERDWYALGRYALIDGRCANCGELLAGVFDDVPERFGPRRIPLRIV